ncbi:hypothetical protein FIBSPDRAFT_491194 [Athelia psychrophila]|uniref:Uncharacterized protein n=1 Tax=Athelia psychrophila TaxID=1759441 RepID=A0A166KMQ7_9AGAM|nr:hypothetical protein FIBSPDRAFT_491194 [Fibularhizoctonia sp. CBS 109695]
MAGTGGQPPVRQHTRAPRSLVLGRTDPARARWTWVRTVGERNMVAAGERGGRERARACWMWPRVRVVRASVADVGEHSGRGRGRARWTCACACAVDVDVHGWSARARWQRASAVDVSESARVGRGRERARWTWASAGHGGAQTVREFPRTFCERTGAVKCLGGEMGWREQVEAPPARQRVHAQCPLACSVRGGVQKRRGISPARFENARGRRSSWVGRWVGEQGEEADSARTRNIRWPVLPAAASRRRGISPARFENARGRRSSWVGRWVGGSRGRRPPARQRAHAQHPLARSARGGFQTSREMPRTFGERARAAKFLDGEMGWREQAGGAPAR